MTQNTSHAVMAQRAEPRDSLDFFPTPPWATRALCEFLGLEDFKVNGTAWEPACGAGHMARALSDYFTDVIASDVADLGYGIQHDFLMPFQPPGVPDRPHLIVTNPPFRLAADFARQAIALTGEYAALLVRTAFLEGKERWRDLFRPHPPSTIVQFCERVPMHKGRCLRTASTATAYCWIIWQPGQPPSTPAFHWIPPGTRKRLERHGDYDDDAPRVGASAA